MTSFNSHIINICLSQWSRGLRHGSTAARLLGLRVRVLPGHGCLFLVSKVLRVVKQKSLRRANN